MTGSHIAGAGLGAIVGAVLVSLGTRIGLDLTNVDSAALGIGCVAAFTAIGHAIGDHGLLGIVRVLLHGRDPQPAPAPVEVAKIVTPKTPAKA